MQYPAIRGRASPGPTSPCCTEPATPPSPPPAPSPTTSTTSKTRSRTRWLSSKSQFCKMTRANTRASNEQKLDMVLLCMPSQFGLVKFGWELSCLVSVGIIWFGVVEFKLVWRMSLVWCGWVWFGVVEFGLICMSLVWYGWVRFGLVWLSLSLVWWGWFLFGLEDEHWLIVRAQAQLSSWVYELVYACTS